MHKTNAGEKRKALQREARELAREARAATNAAKVQPEARHKAHELQEEADKALALKPLARKQQDAKCPFREP